MSGRAGGALRPAAGPGGPLLVLGAVLAGIALGERRGPAAATADGAVGLVAVATAVALRLRPAHAGSRARPASLVLAVVALLGVAGVAGAATSRALDGLVHSPVAPLVAGRTRAVVDVTLSADPSATRWSARGLARVDRLRIPGRGVRPGAGRTVVVDASGAAAARLAVLRAGDRVRLAGYFRPRNPFEARLRWRHAVGTFAADDLRAFRGPGSPLLVVANWLRDRVLAGHRHLPEPQRSLLASFLLGGVRGVPDWVVAEFRAAGLSHLLVVSGENVAFVLVLVGPLARRLPLGGRTALALIVLVVFAAMTRFEPSVLRASAMAACSVLAVALGRPVSGLRALVLAVTALLLIDPFLVHSVGFRLSVAATVGIATVGTWVSARLPGPRALAEAVGVTVGAQVGVGPMLVATFGPVPLVSLPANLAAAPFVGPLTIAGLVGGVVGGLVPAPVVGAVTGLPAYLGATAVLVVARVASRQPLGVGAPGLAAVVGAGLVGVFVLGRVRRATWRRADPPAPRAP